MIVKLEKVKRKVEIVKIAPKLIQNHEEKPITNNNINSNKSFGGEFLRKLVLIIT